ncbi:MAG: PQQ-binding-like beta-propeller repeat protein [Patescibacteria group bacterium]
MKNIWPKFKGDIYNSGQSSVDLTRVGQGKKPWVFQTQGLVWSSAIIDEKDNVYVGSTDGYFYALDEKGNLRWKYKINDGPDSIIDSAATFMNGMVIIPGGDGCLHAVDQKTGRKQWIFQPLLERKNERADRSLVSSFEGNVVYNEELKILYAGSDDGCLYALDQDGQELWHFATGMMVWALPVFGENNQWLALGGLDGYIYFLDPVNGDQREKKYLGSEIKSSPTYDPKSKSLLIATSAGVLYCAEVDVEKNNHYWHLVWREKLESEVYSSPSYREGKVAVGKMSGYLDCYSLEGKKLWSTRLGSSISSSPVISHDGQVIVGCRNGQVYAVNLGDGRELGRCQVGDGLGPANIDSSPALTRAGEIVFGSYDGGIYSVPIDSLTLPLEKNILGKKEKISWYGLQIANSGVVDGQPYQMKSVYDPIKIKIFDREQGDSTPVKFTRKYSVNIEPALAIQTNFSSDGRYIFITPQEFWVPGVVYHVWIKAEIDDQASWLKSMLPISMVKVETELSFVFSRLLETQINESWLTPEILLHSFFLNSHRDLETYAAAALFNQKFLLKIYGGGKQSNSLRAKMTSYEDKMNNAVFQLSGERRGWHYRLKGGFKVAVMGAILPINDLYLAGTIDPASHNQITDFIFQIPILGIRENRQVFQFPPQVLRKLVDRRMKIIGLAQCRVDFLNN